MSHRQPIVAILGHVDHGKTTLLDYLRKSHRVGKEVGGITQSIGAYQAVIGSSQITFIDTPGHAAFSKMRSRGVTTADLAVLVVAADDGVMPQTLESIKLLEEAKLPFVVAVTKLDKPGVNLEFPKAGLAQAGVFVEGYGGNVPIVGISAKTGEGITTLLETLTLLSDLEELPYLDSAPLEAPIIESQKSSHTGVAVSVIVKQGTLRVGDALYTATASGKVKAIENDHGASVQALKPGEPGRILGFATLPLVGEIVVDTPPPPPSPTLATTPIPTSPTASLKLILHADSNGSLEAIMSNLTPEVQVLSHGVGDVNESDILLASASGALVLGFGVRAPSSVQKLAELEHVTLKTFGIIYDLLAYLEKKVLRLLEPTIDEEELGVATILKIFEINRDKIAGVRVDKGVLSVGDTLHIKRGELTKEARIRGMRIGKNEVKQAPAGAECGILFSTNLDIAPKDLIISYKKIITDTD